MKVIGTDGDDILVRLTRGEFLAAANLQRMPEDYRNQDYNICAWIFAARRKINDADALCNSLVDFLRSRTRNLTATDEEVRQQEYLH